MQCSLYEEVKCFRVGKTRIFVMDISCSYKGRVNRAEFVKKKKKKALYFIRKGCMHKFSLKYNIKVCFKDMGRFVL